MTTFLLVEDNSQMRQALRQMLSDLGEIFECGDGTKAFSAFEKYRPDWVLMDVELGETDGITITAEIIDAFPEARVLMVTMYGDEALRTAAQRAGAAGYVLKDNLQEVRRVVTSITPVS